MMTLPEKRLFIEKYNTVTSTNDILKAKALDGAPEGTVIIANAQTNGRGRMGRRFYSPEGNGIYMSILLRPIKKAPDHSYITAHAAVSVAKAIEKHTKKQTKIKWVNDIYMNGRKVCGILTECFYDASKDTRSCIVIGIGINLNEPEHGYPVHLQEIAGAIFDAKESYDKNALINDILTMFFNNDKNDPNIFDEYKNHCMLEGKMIVVSHGGVPQYTAKVLKIDDSFGLCIRLSDGTETVLRSGEISIKEI